MTYEEFVPLYEMLIVEKQTQEEFLNALPTSISDAFFDNELVESLEKQKSYLVEALVKDEDLLEVIYYFLYEHHCVIISADGTRNEYLHLDDKLAYFKEQFFS